MTKHVPFSVINFTTISIRTTNYVFGNGPTNGENEVSNMKREGSRSPSHKAGNGATTI